MWYFREMARDKEKVWCSQKAILVDESGKILTIRRTKTAPSRPLHWDLPGGELDYGENAKESILREIREETGLEVEDLSVFDVISRLNDIGEFWVTACYTALSTTKEVTLSYEHDEVKWVTPQEFQKLDASPRIKQFVETFELLQFKK